MNESTLGIYGTSYKTFLHTARQNTIQDNLFLQTCFQTKKTKRIKTKTDHEQLYQSARIGTANLQSHRSRYVSMQQEGRQVSQQSNCIQKQAACKNFSCLKTISDLQELYEQQKKTIKGLNIEIDKLKQEIAESMKQNIYESRVKERLISSTSKVQVQKSLGILGFSLDSQQLLTTSKTDSMIMQRTISQHNKGENINITQLLNSQQHNDTVKLMEMYTKSMLQNYCYHTINENEIPLPYIKCDRCELIKNQNIIRLECKHQYHVQCLIDSLQSQLQTQQENFNLTGKLYCHCNIPISQGFIKSLHQPQFYIIYQIVAQLQLFNLTKSYQLNSFESKKMGIQKCAKEYCYFIILNSEQKISYCPLCCEFNLFVQIKFI